MSKAIPVSLPRQGKQRRAILTFIDDSSEESSPVEPIPGEEEDDNSPVPFPTPEQEPEPEPEPESDQKLDFIESDAETVEEIVFPPIEETIEDPEPVKDEIPELRPLELPSAPKKSKHKHKGVIHEGNIPPEVLKLLIESLNDCCNWPEFNGHRLCELVIKSNFEFSSITASRQLLKAQEEKLLKQQKKKAKSKWRH